MQRLVAIVMFASALSLLGCATTETTAPKTKVEKPVTTGQEAKPIIKCSTCGVEFTTREQAEEHLKTHPGHKLTPME
jgi:hypothetical protein